MLFESWSSVGHVLATAALAYAALVVLLRVSGKRTLSKLNAFDLVITVALGSTLASVVVSRSVPLVDGLAALVALVAMQFLVAWGATRWRAIDRLAKAEPRAVFYRGAFARDAMRAERVAEGEILAAIRRASVPFEQVEAVILEASGDLSVLGRAPDGGGPAPALAGVRVDGAPGMAGERARASGPPRAP